ncbi:hypothetical protein HK096_006004, partial [Nowakowskiella sp. JEL0078]
MSRVAVVYGQQQLECVLDLSQAVDTVLRDVCLAFGLPAQITNKCLRLHNEQERLLSKDVRFNIALLIENGLGLLLVDSPQVSAVNISQELGKSSDDFTLKKLLFPLKNYLTVCIFPSFVVEQPFVDLFLKYKGLERIQTIIGSAQGNTLAYALVSLQTLMEHSSGWDNFNDEFIRTLVSIIVKQNLVNICRPATAIIIKLVLADISIPNDNIPIQNYGFNVVYKALSSQLSFLPTLVRRLKGTDYLLQIGSLNLINVLFRYATDQYRNEFVYMLDSLKIRVILKDLILATPPSELSTQLHEFQRLLILEGNRRKRISVDPQKPNHEEMLIKIWEAANVIEFDNMKWRLIGFDSERPYREFSRVGLLGLELLHTFAVSEQEYFSKFIHDQLQKQEIIRCPLAKAHIEVLEILSDHWGISTGYTT